MLTRVLVFFLFFSALALSCPGQESVRPDPEHRQWYLDSGEMTYVVGVNDQNMLQASYWGPRLPPGASVGPALMQPERASFDPPIESTPLEFPAWGAGLDTEPALKVDSPNGDRTLVLVFDQAHIDGPQLEVVLKDKVQPISVHLFYRTYPEGIIARWSRIENTGRQSFRVEQAMSATLNVPTGTNYEWSWVTGQWGAEWQIHTEPLQVGSNVLESRRGSTGHQSNPWFALGREHQTTEGSGPVWFGELGWSGSWRMVLERTALNHVRLTAGYNPFDFSYTLQPGESLDTPPLYAGYTMGGNGEASRILHRFQMAEILPTHPAPKPRPIVYNSWEATEFAVDEPWQMALAERAAKLGVERFVVDDGWFGERNSDRAGLGDWYVNKAKFPHGLKPLIDRVHSLGMDFGLWVEPEMVNRDSQLYRDHPDWVMHFPDRQRTEARNQLVLNLARQDVKQYVLDSLDRLLSENDIAFLKWDYNRNWSEPGWAAPPGSTGQSPDIEAQKEIYVRYIQNLYGILAELRKRHPQLEIESCSGGGGRVDLGILRYTDEVWPSDNTDALDRLDIQDGFTHVYAPEIMVAWVTDVPNFLDKRITPLQFRFLAAMQGALGVGGNLNNWTPEDLSTATRLIAFYKSIRSTVQHGRLFRLQTPERSEESQVEYVAEDGAQAVLLAYLHSQHYGLEYPRVYPHGLEPAATYRIRPLDATKYTGQTVISGAVLMGEGMTLKLGGDYDSTALVLERVSPPTR